MSKGGPEPKEWNWCPDVHLANDDADGVADEPDDDEHSVQSAQLFRPARLHTHTHMAETLTCAE